MSELAAILGAVTAYIEGTSEWQAGYPCGARTFGQARIVLVLSELAKAFAEASCAALRK